MRRGSGAARQRGSVVIAGILMIAACQPYTTRPSFGPLPGAAAAVVDLDIPTATTTLADALRADSFPVSRVEPVDGYLETGWFDAATGKTTKGRILGDSVVRVRGWVNAYGKERGSIRVETAVRPLANPSLPPRELDRQAPADNPVAIRVAAVLTELAKQYPVPGAEPPAEAPAKGPTKGKMDSMEQAPADSVISKPGIVKPPKGQAPEAP